MAKRIFKTVLCILLALLLLASIILFLYFPYYLLRKHPVEMTANSSIRMMSCNLRCLSPLDLGPRSWFCRADLIMEELETHSPGIIGFQEATRWQYDYFVDTLPQYDSVITYRDDTLFSEGCPIFYRQDLYTLVDKGSFWLSETPEVMSKDWGAAHYRICSYVILTDNTTGKDFVVFNTHLDHVSDEARVNGIHVVLDKIKALGSLPSVIMGDLNAEEGSVTYSGAAEYFLDARYAAAENTDSGTYHNWGKLKEPRRIDYFMVSPSGFTIHRYDVITNIHYGIYASDHRPIVLDVTLQ